MGGVDEIPSGKGHTVLVVEDDDAAASFIKTVLEREGFVVVVATNGRDGFDKCQHQDFSVIVTDIVMPELDGVDFIRKVKQGARNSMTPVVLITGSDRGPPVVEGMQAGAVFFLAKPFSPAQLRRVVYTVMK